MSVSCWAKLTIGPVTTAAYLTSFFFMRWLTLYKQRICFSGNFQNQNHSLKCSHNLQFGKNTKFDLLLEFQNTKKWKPFLKY